MSSYYLTGKLFISRNALLSTRRLHEPTPLLRRSMCPLKQNHWYQQTRTCLRSLFTHSTKFIGCLLCVSHGFRGWALEQWMRTPTLGGLLLTTWTDNKQKKLNMNILKKKSGAGAALWYSGSAEPASHMGTSLCLGCCSLDPALC